MKTTITTTVDTLLVHHQSELASAVDRLALRHGVQNLSNMFADFVYFLANPEHASDIEKGSILDHAVDCISLLGLLSAVYEKFDSLKAYTAGLSQ